MPPTICVFEDVKYRQFFPLTMLRPVFLLRAGILPLIEKTRRNFPDSPVCLAVREQIASMTARTCKDYPVNMVKKSGADILFLNGRIRDYGDLPGKIDDCRLSTIFESNGETVAILFKSNLVGRIPEVAAPSQYTEFIEASHEHVPSVATSAVLYNYCWEIMSDIGPAITSDFECLKPDWSEASNCKIHDDVHLLNADEIVLGDSVTIYPDVVINAEEGPVYVGPNCRIESGVTITGPCFVGANSIVYPGTIAGSSIGHTCRVGGEIESSIFHEYVNKHHAGFIGHSYVGPWVNFGAMTTNSDLKNNYSAVRLMLNGESIDSSSTKVGSFIGDHTKFGIGMLLNTGINIGVCCNIFGGSLVTAKEIASFSWGGAAGFETYQFEKAIATAHAVAERRNATITDAEVGVLWSIAKNEISDAGTLNIESGPGSIR